MEWKFLAENKAGPARKSKDYRLFSERVIQSAQLLEKSLSEYIVREDEDLNTNKLLKETREIIALSDDPTHTFRILRHLPSSHSDNQSRHISHDASAPHS